MNAKWISGKGSSGTDDIVDLCQALGLCRYECGIVALTLAQLHPSIMLLGFSLVKYINRM